MFDERSVPEGQEQTMAEEAKRRGRPPKQENRTVFGLYLVENNLNQDEVAEQLGCSRVYVAMMAGGHKYPAAELMWKIEQWSEGAVSMQSWFTGGES